jgi:ADP-heptose:LPS heptosyltransferase
MILPVRHYIFARRQLMHQDFDVCFVPRRDADDVYATMLGYFSRSARCIAFSEKCTPRKAVINRSFDTLLTDCVSDPGLQHETLSNLKLLESIGISPSSRALSVDLSPSALLFAQEVLPGPHSSYIAICPTSGHSELKQWGVERFADVAARLASSGFVIVLLGGPGDVSLGKTIQAAVGSACKNFIGKTTLAEMTALIAQCAVFLGNDAGPMHVASALGVGTVAVFGPSCHHRFGPWGRSQCLIVHQLPCSPCHDHSKDRCESCIHDQTLCLQHISTVEVLSAVTSMMANYEGNHVSGSHC